MGSGPLRKQCDALQLLLLRHELFYFYPDSVREAKKNQKHTSFSRTSTFAGAVSPLVPASVTPAGNSRTKEYDCIHFIFEATVFK